MKHSWMFLLVACSVFGGEQKQSFENRYWGEILKGTDIVLKANDSLVRAFIDAPECFIIRDTSGVPLLDGISKYVDPLGNGWLLVVVVASPAEALGVKRDSMKVVKKDAPLIAHIIQPILIYTKKDFKK